MKQSAPSPPSGQAPKAAIFDLGKVLLDFDYTRLGETLARSCSVTAEEIWRMIDQGPLLRRYETGEITSEEFFAEIKIQCGYRGAYAEFARVFADIFTPIDAMIELHRRLRSAGVPAYIFSNTNPLAVNHIRKRYPFFSDFDDYILSCEHGAMKPNDKLYEVVERVSELSGSDLLYIDDRPENIATAQQRGWQGILHLTPSETELAVIRSGIIPS